LTEIVDERLDAAREAVARRAWREAADLFKAADGETPLAAADVELLAEAVPWTGHGEEQLALLERAFKAHVDEGNGGRAAFVATRLAHEFANHLQPAVSSGWMSRAKRLLDEEPEAAEHGYWLLQRALSAAAANELDESLALAEKAEAIGRRVGDRSLEIRGLQRRGAALIASGQVAEGKALLDEASAAAVAGELDPFSTMVVYCNTIGACRDVADFDRAGEWTNQAVAFCDENSLAAFPGLCRVNYAEVMKYKGRLHEAHAEAGRAGEELRAWCPRIAGAAFYELGEVRLRLGELDLAEQAFREGDEFGKAPEPGLALLRLAQGNTRGAWTSIRRALGDEGMTTPQRARLLPAAVEIAVAAGEVDAADEFARELAETAAMYETSALKAAASFARGSVKAARGDTSGSFACFREARRLWDATGATYDAARARERLGLAARAEGDEESALWDLQAAAARFERVGAARDAERVAEVLRRDLSAQVTMTFLFTDIVKSTDLLSTIEDRHWANVLRRHDDTLRAIFSDYGGQVVDHTGDGFFVAFDKPADAVQAAVAVQRAVDQEFVFDVRIGIHTDGALKQRDNYHGRGVHAAARVGAAAEGREILATRASVGHLPHVATVNSRSIMLKGLPEPVDVCSVEWR
jgi:class 3 adenylate cyclase